MTDETVFNSINAKLELDDEGIVIDNSLISKTFGVLKFSLKPNKIPFENIEKVYTVNRPDSPGKARIFIEYGEGKTKFRFYNKNNSHVIKGESLSLDGAESVKRFARFLETEVSEEYKFDVNVNEIGSSGKGEDDSEGYLAKMSKEKEFKRTCNECGEVWHVLASREDKVKSDQFSSSLGQVGAAMSCCLPLSALFQNNAQSAEEQLDKMRSCPECGSHNYEEETIRYEK